MLQGAFVMALAIVLDEPWKHAVYEFAGKNLQHSAWGLEHAERDYQLALRLAKDDGLTVDHDVIFAAAFLHDMGALAPYMKEGVDHAERSADLVGGVLQERGFPAAKIPK